MRSSRQNYDDATIRHYIQTIRDLPILSHDEEYMLAKEWKEKSNSKAIEKIINSHLKLVAKIASGYRGYGLPLADLIAEGNIGIMNAVKHFDPDRGFRFSTYAIWWIRASMQEYVLYSWSMVKMGTTSAQKKLFFNLRRLKEDLHDVQESDYLSNKNIEDIAKKLNVRVEDVIQMNQRMSAKDSSLNTSLRESAEDKASEWIEWIPDDTESLELKMVQDDEMNKRRALFKKALECLSPREHQILVYRRLTEPSLTLDEVSQKIGISRERVRQIEVQAFEKIQKRIKNLVTLHHNNI